VIGSPSFQFILSSPPLSKFIFVTIRPLLLALAAFPSLAFSIADWVVYPVDSRVTVQTPSVLTPIDLVKALTARGASKEQLAPYVSNQVKLLVARDETGIYMVMRMATGDPETPSNSDSTGRRAYYAGLLDAQLRDEHGTLLHRSTFSIGGVDGIEYDYKGIHQGTGKMVVKHSRAILVDKVSYGMTFLAADAQDSLGTAGQQQKDKFFRSLTIKKKL
jgi:hypothetical protein